MVLQDNLCAVLISGAVKCWGYNGDGQVIAPTSLRGIWVCILRHCAADEVISAGW